jgi:hypothetical protein
MRFFEVWRLSTDLADPASGSPLRASTKGYQESVATAVDHWRRCKSRQVAQASVLPKPPHQLYSHGRDLAWWRKQRRSLTDSYTLDGLRLFKKEEFEILFGESMRAAKAVRALEVLFPALTARICAYLLADFFKPLGSATVLPAESNVTPDKQ